MSSRTDFSYDLLCLLILRSQIATSNPEIALAKTGGFVWFRPLRPVSLDITICDIKDSYSSFESYRAMFIIKTTLLKRAA